MHLRAGGPGSADFLRGDLDQPRHPHAAASEAHDRARTLHPIELFNGIGYLFIRGRGHARPELDEQGVEHVRAALTTAGSRSFVDDLATQQLREATTLAEDLSLPPELVTWVGEVAGSLEGGVA